MQARKVIALYIISFLLKSMYILLLNIFTLTYQVIFNEHNICKTQITTIEISCFSFFLFSYSKSQKDWGINMTQYQRLRNIVNLFASWLFLFLFSLKHNGKNVPLYNMDSNLPSWQAIGTPQPHWQRAGSSLKSQGPISGSTNESSPLGYKLIIFKSQDLCLGSSWAWRLKVLEKSHLTQSITGVSVNQGQTQLTQVPSPTHPLTCKLLSDLVYCS